MSIEMIYDTMYIAVMIVLAIFLFPCLYRAVKGPRVGDRLVAINMMGTIIMVLICVTAFRMKEDYLIDVAIIYAVLSFLANVLLSKVYIGVHIENQMKKKLKEKE